MTSFSFKICSLMLYITESQGSGDLTVKLEQSLRVEPAEQLSGTVDLSVPPK